MSNTAQKQRPASVPEENVYNSIHWTIIIAVVAVCVAVYFAVAAG